MKKQPVDVLLARAAELRRSCVLFDRSVWSFDWSSYLKKEAGCHLYWCRASLGVRLWQKRSIGYLRSGREHASRRRVSITLATLDRGGGREPNLEVGKHWGPTKKRQDGSSFIQSINDAPPLSARYVPTPLPYQFSNFTITSPLTNGSLISVASR